MATRTISFDFRQPDASGVDQPTGGLVTIRPWPDRMRPTDGHYYVVAEPVTLLLVDGQVTVPLEVTGGTWCWRIDGPTEVRFITVPAGAGTLPFTDCPDVDPATLQATAQPEAAWWVALEALADLVGEGGGGTTTVEGLTDATSIGKAVVKAATQAAARSAIGAGTVMPADVTAAINSLVASAPGTLDTLAELATALGNDPNFATTIMNLLAARVRVDTASQGLTGTQQTNALTNLGGTTLGRALVAIADAAAARAAIGAGTSSVALGLGSGQALDAMVGDVVVEYDGAAWPTRPSTVRCVVWRSTKHVAAPAPTGGAIGDCWDLHPDAA